MLQRTKAVVVKIKGLVENNLKLTVLALVVLVSGMAFISYEGLHFSSDPQFCQRCHPLEKVGPLGEVYTWKKSKHAMAGIQCLDCHAVPGFIGYMRAKMGGLYDVYGEFIKGPEHKMHILLQSQDSEHAAKVVPNQTCMYCHTDSYNQKIRSERFIKPGVSFRFSDKVVNPEFRKKRGLPDILTGELRPETGVDPRHPKHFANGIDCVDCHLHITHSGITGYRTSMQLCYDCHDAMRKEGKNPPANEDCVSCHRREDDMIPQRPIVFGKGEETVSFKHSTHTALFKCSECHEGRFVMNKGTAKVTFADHSAGKYCFSCHNGKTATSDCSNCHAKIPIPKQPISYKLKGGSPVQFSHEFHTQVFACTECHTTLWPMKRGAEKMTMDAMYQGKYCGACHNGKTAAQDCAKCHAKVPVPKQPISYKVKGGSPVQFSHEFHTQVFACTDCHIKVWSMKRGAKKMTMDAMYEGKYCGTCHNGKDAFESTECDKCHLDPKKK